MTTTSSFRQFVIASVGVSVGVLSLALTGCTHTTDGVGLAAEPGPLPPAEVSALDLPGLLLTPTELDAAADLSSMRVRDESTEMWNDSDRVDNTRCLGVWTPTQIAAYAGSDYTVMRGSTLTDATSDDADADAIVEQAVVRFASPDAAHQFSQASASQWADCDSQLLNVTRTDGKVRTWQMSDFADAGDTLTMRVAPMGMASGGCLRGLRAHSNVVIDVMVCGEQVTDQAAAITGAIADGMPQL